MATPRVVPQQRPIDTTNWRKLADFPSCVAAEDKLTDLQTRRGFKEQEHLTADKIIRHSGSIGTSARIESEARALVGGEVATIEPPPDIAQIQRDIAVLDRAIELQTRVVADERSKMAREIAADLRPDHVEAMNNFLLAQKAAFEALERLKALTAAATAHVGTACLQDFSLGEINDVGQNVVHQYRHRLQIFESTSAAYRGGK